MTMDLPGLASFHNVEFLGFYLPPLILWAAIALVVFVFVRMSLEWSGFYRFVWHRPLFNLALFVLLLGGVASLGNRSWL